MAFQLFLGQSPPSTQVKTALRDFKRSGCEASLHLLAIFAQSWSSHEKIGKKRMQRNTVTQGLHVTALEAEILCHCAKVRNRETLRAHRGAVKTILWSSLEQFPPGAHSRCFSPLCLIRQVLSVNTGDYGVGEGDSGGQSEGRNQRRWEYRSLHTALIIVIVIITRCSSEIQIYCRPSNKLVGPCSGPIDHQSSNKCQTRTVS